MYECMSFELEFWNYLNTADNIIFGPPLLLRSLRSLKLGWAWHTRRALSKWCPDIFLMTYTSPRAWAQPLLLADNQSYRGKITLHEEWPTKDKEDSGRNTAHITHMENSTNKDEPHSRTHSSVLDVMAVFLSETKARDCVKRIIKFNWRVTCIQHDSLKKQLSYFEKITYESGKHLE